MGGVDETLNRFKHSTIICLIRVFGWSMLSVLGVYLINNYLIFWRGWPGILGAAKAGGHLGWLQAGFYIGAIALATLYATSTCEHSLRHENARVSSIASYLMRMTFWAVLLVGASDLALSLFRLENLLVPLFGEALAAELILADFRGIYVHMPLIALSLVIAALTQEIGVTWLALLIVVAELIIVISRFVFSYEQAFMGDLVRFWYAGLFLFSSAYTLREGGHVRVDVIYADLSTKAKGAVNFVGTLLLGMPFCWVILVIGTASETGIFNSALTGFEITGTGYGMFVKYLLSVFLGVFALIMLVQFVAYLFEAAADYLGLPDNDELPHRPSNTAVQEG
ncbi:MAG: TRAP transporter small permease subunit [Parvibaculaceae bacterium]